MNVELRIQNGELKMRKPLRNSALFFALFALSLLFLSISRLNAQSLDTLINEALKNNPQLKSLQYKITASEKRTESINTLPAPNLSVEFSQVPTNSVDILNQSNSNNIALSQMFPLGGKLNAMAEVERKNTLVEGNNYEIYKINLTAAVKMSYYTLWLIDRKIEVQKKNNSLIADLIKSVESSYYTNKINQADVLTLQSEIASNETQLLILGKQKEAEIYKLNSLVGRNLDSKDVLIIEDFPADILNSSQAKLEEILGYSNPALKRMGNMVEMNKAMIEANNRELIPDLMVQGMFMRMPRGMILTSKSDLSMLDPKTETMYSLMFSINLPFAPWSVNKFKAKEEELYAGIKSIEYEKNNMQREMTAQLKAALVKYNTAMDLISLYGEKVLPLYRNATESQVSAFQNNRTGVTTVIDSYRMLLMQQMNYYMAKADTQMSLAEIEMMVGKTLKNNEVSK
ncbi:MAG: outer membrane protein [Stygiobacter sp.]|nr:MAG: outer membrane protein [Stygiobacter sp.]KAF0217998.1 MAG: outer membrane [Ignavibacteria bacterium]